MNNHLNLREIKSVKRVFLPPSVLVGLLLLCGVVLADVISPVTQLNQIANKMIAELENNQAKLKTPAANQIINNIVDSILVPNVDMDRMGSSVLGRQYWNSATPAQKQDFLNQFKLLLISTYASALASYDDDKIQFYPIRGDYASANTILVRSVIVRKNGQRISIDYNLTRSGSGWKVYDFSIDNISMVQSYRSQFANVLASGGLNGLLQRMHQHNKR